MGPLGAIKRRKIGKIFIVNSGGSCVPDDSIPDCCAGCQAIFKSLYTATVREPNENDFAPATPEFFHGCSNVVKALFHRVPHLFCEFFFRKVTRWRWRSKKRKPDLLNGALQFSRSGASFDHPLSTFAIQSSEVWRDPRRHERIRAIGNW